MSKPRKPEVTGAEVAHWAAKILGAKDISYLNIWNEKAGMESVPPSIVRAICASATTQAPDHEPPKWSALPVKAAPRLKRGPGAKPLGKFKRRVNLRVRPRPSK